MTHLNDIRLTIIIRNNNDDLFLISDLKRHFETDPYNQQVARGQQVQMRCHPPRGRPKPVVYWKRNGRRIDGAKDKNYMITNDGHLILVAARLSDTGNYTCIAENIANLRPSDTAQLTVYGKTLFYLHNSSAEINILL